MRAFILILLLVQTSFVSAQSWIKNIVEQMDGITYDSIGDFVGVRANDASSCTFTRFNNKGEIIRENTLPYLNARTIIRTSDNGFLFSAPNNTLVKTDTAGNEEWSQPWTTCSKILEDDQNNYLLSDFNGIPGNSLVKVSNSGNEVWSRTYPFFTMVGIATAVSGYMAGGYDGTKFIIAKLNYDGDTLYTKNYSINQADVQEFIGTPDGGYLAVVSSSPSYLIKLNSAGDTLWSKQMGVIPVDISASGNHYFIADNRDRNKISKINYDGSISWKVIAPELIKQIIALPDGGALAICLLPFANPNKTLLVRIDKDGKIYHNFIKGKLFKDANNNCIQDAGEDPLPGMMVSASPGFYPYAFTDANGNYEIPADTAVNYAVSPYLYSRLWENNCTSSHAVFFAQKGMDSLGKNFAIHPVLCPDIQVYINTGNRITRCFTQTHKIVCRNLGNTLAEDVVVTLEVPSVLKIKNSSVPYSLTGNKLTFMANDIAPQSQLEIVFEDSTSCTAALNTRYYLRATAQTPTTCVYPSMSSDTAIVSTIVSGSYDPNDKQAFPSTISFNDYTNGAKEIEYLIRFQNSGNGPAVNIKISDTLSSLLDFSTIREITTSHPGTWEVVNGDRTVLEWKFRNINLPYQSQDDAGSQGFVSFVIDLAEGAADGTIISNKAAIYFDYNDPIITNEATVEINSLRVTEDYEAEVISSISKPSAGYLFSLTPNPLSDRAEIKIYPASDNVTFDLFDSKGTHAKQLPINGEKAILEKEALQPGIYFYRILKDHQVIGAGKVVVQ